MGTEADPKIRAFLDDYKALILKHGLRIGSWAEYGYESHLEVWTLERDDMTDEESADLHIKQIET